MAQRCGFTLDLQFVQTLTCYFSSVLTGENLLALCLVSQVLGCIKKKHWTHFNNHCFHQNFMFFSFETQTHDLESHTHDTKLCITTYAEKMSHLIGWWEKMFNDLDNLLMHARHSGGVRHSCNPNWQFNENAQYSAVSATRGLSIKTKQKVFLRWLRLR